MVHPGVPAPPSRAMTRDGRRLGGLPLKICSDDAQGAIASPLKGLVQEEPGRPHPPGV